MSEVRRLLLVDGLAGVYRAFFAIRNMSTKDGRPTNAVFGFIRMLEQLVRHWQPTHLAVVFDGGVPPYRYELLEEYKAQRPSMPDELREQLPLINRYLACASIESIRLDDEEADDVLAHLSRWAQADAEHVWIATHDKDMLQLVSDRVALITLSGEPKATGRGGVKEKTGVMPEQIVEWLALVGDSADNIAGVKGIGPKTAAKLLGEFGSLSEVWSRMEEVVPERHRLALTEGRPLVERNVKLMKLERDVACHPRWDDLRMREPDVRALLELYGELEFHALARDLREPDLFG